MYMEAPYEPRALAASANQMLTCPGMATICPFVVLYVLTKVRIGKQHHTKITPKSAKVRNQYLFTTFSLSLVSSFLPKINELISPSIPPKANALEAKPLSGMKSLQRIWLFSSQKNVPIQLKKKISPKPILPMTAVNPAQRARDAPTISRKEEEVKVQVIVETEVG